MANEKINYLEFPSKDLEATKTFFKKAFNWSFTDYGPEYVAFSEAGLDGGFFKSDMASTTSNGSALAVLYSTDLPNTLKAVEHAGGIIIKQIYEFPGGRRFHFLEPGGNELAVWSDLSA